MLEHKKTPLCSISDCFLMPPPGRIGVLALKGLHPGPLDDGGSHALAFTQNHWATISVSFKSQPPHMQGLISPFHLFPTRD
jgi:hypothetical protein